MNKYPLEAFGFGRRSVCLSILITIKPCQIPYPEYAPEGALVQLKLGYLCVHINQRHVAEVTVWLAVARVLACFDISQAVDESGNPIQPAADFTSGVLRYLRTSIWQFCSSPDGDYSRPKPFPCRIVPRSEGTVELINQAQEE